MKTKENNNTDKGLSIRPEIAQQTNGNSQTAAQPPRVLPFVNHDQRAQNRALPKDQVLDLLRQWMPDQLPLAEIVGAWIWITFPEPPAEAVRAQLSQFGFHWNNTRKCWQHPCGSVRKEPATRDPRQKYGTVRAVRA